MKIAAVWIAIAGDLLPGFLAYNTTYDPLPPEPAAFRSLPRDERVLVDLESPYHRVDVGNFLVAYGLSTPSGYASQFPRAYGEMVQALGGQTSDRRIEFPADAKRAFRALNVRAILSSRGEERIVPLPRAWLVGACEILAKPVDRLRRISDPSFDPARNAILESVLRLDGEPRGLVESAGDQDYRVVCDHNSLQVLSETWAPGWTCTIDGAPLRSYGRTTP